MTKSYLKFLLSVLALFAGSGLSAQTYSGPRAYDGVHKNEISGYLTGGFNVVTDWFFGEAATYTRHLSDRWSISGGEQAQLLKQLYSLDVMGTYRLPFRYGNVYFDGRLLLNRYNQWRVYEGIANFSISLETPHFDMRIGESLIRYRMNHVKDKNGMGTDAGYTEPLVMTFGLGVNILPRANKWNLGLFIRNYDQFYYENWNINWGVRFHASLPLDMKLFGEFNVRPAGSISQLATRYETSMKMGVKYVW